MIGCGTIAGSHLSAARNNGLPVTAACDVSPQALGAFLNDVPEARGFASAAELLEQGGVDAVVIGTPPCHHAETAVAALERGIHVLCEKPLAISVEQARAVEKAAAASQAVFMMAFRHRFTAAQQAIKAVLDSGQLGRIILFENVFGGPMRQMAGRWFARRAISGGGALIDTSIHSIDLFRHYCGEIASFGGEWDRAFEGTDVEDSAVLSLRAENGALGIVASSWNFGTGVAGMRILAEKGSVTYDYQKPKVYHLMRAGETTPEAIEVEATRGVDEQLAHFVRTIAEGIEPCPGVRDGRRAVEIVEAVYRQRPLP